jgi:hypothetical protein
MLNPWAYGPKTFAAALTCFQTRWYIYFVASFFMTKINFQSQLDSFTIGWDLCKYGSRFADFLKI